MPWNLIWMVKRLWASVQNQPYAQRVLQAESAPQQEGCALNISVVMYPWRWLTLLSSALCEKADVLP